MKHPVTCRCSDCFGCCCDACERQKTKIETQACEALRSIQVTQPRSSSNVEQPSHTGKDDGSSPSCATNSGLGSAQSERGEAGEPRTNPPAQSASKDSRIGSDRVAALVGGYSKASDHAAAGTVAPPAAPDYGESTGPAASITSKDCSSQKRTLTGLAEQRDGAAEEAADAGQLTASRLNEPKVQDAAASTTQTVTEPKGWSEARLATENNRVILELMKERDAAVEYGKTFKQAWDELREKTPAASEKNEALSAAVEFLRKNEPKSCSCTDPEDGVTCWHHEVYSKVLNASVGLLSRPERKDTD